MINILEMSLGYRFQVKQSSQNITNNNFEQAIVISIFF